MALVPFWNIHLASLPVQGGERDVSDAPTAVYYDSSGWSNVSIIPDRRWDFFEEIWGFSATDVFLATASSYIVHFDGVQFSTFSHWTPEASEAVASTVIFPKITGRRKGKNRRSKIYNPFSGFSSDNAGAV